MNDKTLKTFIIAISVLLVLIYLKFGNSRATFVKSSKDEQFHLVQDLPDKSKAADIIAELKKRMKLLIKHMIEKFPERGDVAEMKMRFDENNIQETDINDPGTSFSIDKGEELHLCIRDKETLKFHHLNLLTFVSVHELAHIMSESFGHNGEFSENFRFLLKEAVNIGIYKSIDYSKNPIKYCSTIDVTENPLFS